MRTQGRQGVSLALGTAAPSDPKQFGLDWAMPIVGSTAGAGTLQQGCCREALGMEAGGGEWSSCGNASHPHVTRSPGAAHGRFAKHC